MAVPRYINDGDYSNRIQHGASEWVYPFHDLGDDVSFEEVVTFRQDEHSYRRLNLMSLRSTRYGVAYLVQQSQPRSIGNGILEFVCTYASVPETRNEPGTIVYPAQLLSISGSYDFATPPDEPEIATFNISLQSRVEFRYSLSQLPNLIAPRVEVIFGKIFYIGGWGQFLRGAEVIAEDSVQEIYKGRIYVRRTPYVKFPV